MPAILALPILPDLCQCIPCSLSTLLTSVQKGEDVEQGQHRQEPVVDLSEDSRRLLVVVVGELASSQ